MADSTEVIALYDIQFHFFTLVIFFKISLEQMNLRIIIYGDNLFHSITASHKCAWHFQNMQLSCIGSDNSALDT